MTIAVKVVFWGLFALSPAKDSGNVTALFANTPDDGQLAHTAQVWLLKGSCSGECYHGVQLPPGDPQSLQEDKAVILPRLIWYPKQEELRITAPASPVQFVRGSRRNFLGRPERFPGNLGESGDISWIPEMDILTSGQRLLKDDCLTTAAECPISARFIIEKGNVSACHLMHKDGKLMETFDFKARAGSPVIDFNQAVADAAADEFAVEGASIILSAKSFDGKNQVSATLTPDRGEIILLVGNFPSNHNRAQEKAEISHLERPGSHFAIFYDLLANPPAKKPVRHHTLVFHRAEPGSCEDDLINFESKLKEMKRSKDPRVLALIPPHLSTECDMVRLGPQ